MPRFNPQLPVIDGTVSRAFRITHYMRHSVGGNYQCSHYYINPDNTVPNVFDLIATATSWWSLVKAHWSAMTVGQVSSMGVACEDLLVPGGLTGIYNVSPTDPNIAGLYPVVGALPCFNSQAFTRRTALGGQRAKGQCRYPGVPENATDADTFTAAYILLQQAFVTDLSAFLNVVWTGGAKALVPAVVNTTGSFPGVPVVHGSAITAYTLPIYVGSQNSRKVGRGA